MSILERISHDHTLGQLFEERVAATPDAVAYIEYSHVLGKWFSHSWESVHQQAGRAQSLFQQLGLKAGDRIGIMAHGGAYWVTLDLAAAGLGIVTVPLYHRDRGGNVAYVAERSRMRALFIGGHSQWEALEDERTRMPGIEHIFSALQVPDTEVRPFLLELASTKPSPYQVTQKDPASVATIVFTSGTTGRPKGVQLTHANILSNTIAATAAVPIGPDDRLLSFLPLSHMFERTVGYYSPMLHGSTVAFARSVATLREDLRLQPPTVMVSVPRVYEKIYRALTSRRPLNSPLGRLLVSLGRRAGRAGPGLLQQALGLLPRHLIGRKVLEGLGGHLRIAITGGAAMNSRVADFFAGIGLKVLQGYGLTETSPVVSVNREEDIRRGSVGPPIDGVEVRLAADRELLVRGRGVMQGYLENPEATAATIDREGWFHTGDLARIEDGHIYIVGRAKEIIVLSNGEKVPPEDLESALCNDPRISQAWVTGEGRPFLSAVVVVEEPVDEDQLLESMDDLLQDFPGYARVKRLHVETEPWGERDGLLTATLKLRRRTLHEKYDEIISAFYE